MINPLKNLLCIAFGILLPMGMAWGAGIDQDSRYKLMDQQMAYLQNNMKQGIDWSDVCDLPQSNASPAPKDAVLEHWDSVANPPELSTDPDLFKPFQSRMGAEISYINYRESSLGVKEHGPFYGVYGDFDWRPEELRPWILNVFHIDGHMNGGVVDYKSGDGTVNSIPDFMLEPRAWIGRDFSFSDFTRLTPYAGLGYRFLYDHFGKASAIGGYDRMSNYLYAPIGFEIANRSVPGWEFGATAEFDIFIQGWQESYLSNIDSSFPDLQNKQNRGYGLRGSLNIIKRGQRLNFIISPYVRYWNIHQSKTSTVVNTHSQIEVTGFEPANTSTEVGIKLGVQF